MVPSVISKKLGKLRRRERMLRLVWGVARLVALIALVILSACALDWLIDRFVETPTWAHFILLGITAGTGLVAAAIWILLPLVRQLTQDTLALWVEDKTPVLQHRLITVVQMQRPGADVAGISTELLQVVTKQAEEHVQTLNFPSIADHGRVAKSLKVVGLVAPLVAIPFLLWPDLTSVLLARHFLDDREIPRNVYIDVEKATIVRPAGERITLDFLVKNKHFDASEMGDLFVTPTGLPRDRYPLVVKRNEQGQPIQTSDGRYVYSAEVNASSVDFSYHARLGDGRLREAATVKVVPRPIVVEQNAWLVLPAFCGLTPDKKRYEQPQSRGDIVGIPASSARVKIQTQKPVAKTDLWIYGLEAPVDPAKAADDVGKEVLKRIVNLSPKKDEQSEWFEGVFDLKADEMAYRVVVTDEYGFENVPPPRRTLRMLAEEAPQVALLKDYFVTPDQLKPDESLEDYEVDSVPVPLGGVLRVPYLAIGPYGLGQAWFLYRVYRKTESGEKGMEDLPWIKIPLSEVLGSPDVTGPFDPRRGVFFKTPIDKGVEFHAVPSLNPYKDLGRALGGGRYHFHTNGLVDEQGKKVELKEGDRIEFCVEIYADKNGDTKRPIARSETRIQVMATLEALLRWREEIFQERERLQKLDAKQRAVFGD